MYKFNNKFILPLLIGAICQSGNVSAHDFNIIDFDFGINQPPGTDALVQTKTIGTPGVISDGVYAGTIPASASQADAASPYLIFGYLSDSSPVSAWTRQTAITPGVDVGGNHPPPSFDLVNLTADLTSFYVYWNGTEFNQGSSNVTLVDNLDNTYIATWSSLIVGGPFNGQTGNWRLLLNCTTCPDVTLGPSDTLSASQGGQVTRTVTTTGGNVVITSGFGVAPTNYTYNWTSVTDAGITDSDADEGTFTFDPTGLTPGIYIFTHDYTDTTPFPNARGQGGIVLKVVSSASGDVADSDNDGITNDDDDNSLTALQLQSVLGNATTHLVQSDSGTLKLGQTAFCAGTGARITASDIETFGSSTCSAVTDSADTDIKATGVGGFYDFEIHGISQGGIAKVVIPVSEPIPAHATYRKYIAGSGWKIFEVSGDDTIASAPSTSDGVCPDPDSASYTSGLTKGHNCVRLTITDGGPNDADGKADTIIKDPGGVAEIQSGVEANLPGGCSLSGKPESLNKHVEWLLLAAFLAWLGFASRRGSKD